MRRNLLYVLTCLSIAALGVVVIAGDPGNGALLILAACLLMGSLMMAAAGSGPRGGQRFR